VSGLSGPLPPVPREISAATLAAVEAARIATVEAVEAFDEATARLAATDPEAVRVVLGAVVRAVLEDLHPDGLVGDELLEHIRGCAVRAFGWYPEVDVQALIIVVTGAMGVHEPDEEPRRITPAEIARHAPLFLAELLSSPKAGPLEGYLGGALDEIAGRERNEMP
jgi:hypothetical protein